MTTAIGIETEATDGMEIIVVNVRVENVLKEEGIYCARPTDHH